MPASWTITGSGASGMGTTLVTFRYTPVWGRSQAVFRWILMSAGYEWRKIRHVTSTEWAILIWLAIGAGIAGGVFLVARSAVQIGSVAYRVMEKQLSRES